MDKRYQVFISSTYDDLIEERSEVLNYLIKSKYIPSGMELFSASTDEQFEYIKRVLSTCDYVILILAARYGSINKRTNKSFTEMEYEYAVAKKIPILSFLHKDPWNLPDNKRQDENRPLMEGFRRRIFESNSMVQTWKNISDLITAVSISLQEETINKPRMGWIRGDEVCESKSYYNYILLTNQKLERENNMLKDQINQLNQSILKKDKETSEVFETVQKMLDDIMNTKFPIIKVHRLLTADQASSKTKFWK